MKKTILALVFIAGPFTITAQEGELDISFNGDGKFINEDKNSDEEITDMALQPDGKILLVGPINNSSWERTAIFRLDIYGNPDPKFGSQGQVITDFGIDASFGMAVALQADGKIVIAGDAENSTEEGIGLQRLLADGSPDYSFADSSKYFYPVNGSSPHFHYVGLQSDGKIVVGGRYSSGGIRPVLVRFNPNGTPDYSFGDSAVAEITSPTGSLIMNRYLMKPNGGFIGAGYSYVNNQNVFGLVQFTANGQPDGSFGSNGVLLIDFTDDARAYGLALQSDGKIVVSGYEEDNGVNLFALVRILPDGILDQGFGNNGKTSHPILSGDATAYAVSVLGDGKIIAAGDAQGVWNRDFAIARFSANGQLDKSFSIDGMVTKNIGNGNDYVHDAKLQPNGRLVVAGSSYYNHSSSGSNNSSYDFAAARFLAGAGNIGYDEFQSGELEIYPNPASDVLHFNFKEAAVDREVQLINPSGQSVLHRSIAGPLFHLDVSELPSGLYLVKLYDSGQPTAVSKLMIE